MSMVSQVYHYAKIFITALYGYQTLNSTLDYLATYLVQAWDNTDRQI